MRIKNKLAISSLLTITGIGAVAAVGYLSLVATRDNIDRLTAQSTPVQVKTLEVQQLTEQLIADFMRIRLAGNAGEMKRHADGAEERIRTMEATRAEIEKLSREKQPDTAPFRDARKVTVSAVEQRLDNLALFDKESASINAALKAIEGIVTATNAELQGLSADAAKGVVEVQGAIAAGNVATKRLLTVQARLKDMELTLSEMDSVSDKASITPLRERFSAASDEIYELQMAAPGDPTLIKVHESAQALEQQMTREKGGLAQLRGEMLSSKEAESRYVALKRTMLTGIEALNNKVDAAARPIEIALIGHRKQGERAMEFQAKAALCLAASSLISIDSRDLNAGVRLAMLSASPAELQDAGAQLAKTVARMRTSAAQVKDILNKLQQTRMAADVDKVIAGVQKLGDGVGRIVKAKAGVLAGEKKLVDAMERVKSLATEQSSQGEARVKSSAKNQQEMAREVNEGVRGAIAAMALISGIVALLSIVMGVGIARSITRPLNEAVGVANRLATGDMNVALPRPRRMKPGSCWRR